MGICYSLGNCVVGNNYIDVKCLKEVDTTLAELKEEVDRLVEELGGIGHAEIPLYNYSTESWIDDIEIYRHDKNEDGMLADSIFVHALDRST